MSYKAGSEHFILRKLDDFCCYYYYYCNITVVTVVVYLLVFRPLRPLQSVLNAAARLVSGCPRSAHDTPVLMELHWLPVTQRIRYKVCLLVFKCLHGLAPPYLRCLFKPVSDVAGRSALRSSSHGDVIVPRFRMVITSRRCFAYCGPSLWNAFFLSLRGSDLSISTFKSRLKTLLFQCAFS